MIGGNVIECFQNQKRQCKAAQEFLKCILVLIVLFNLVVISIGNKRELVRYGMTPGRVE